MVKNPSGNNNNGITKKKCFHQKSTVPRWQRELHQFIQQHNRIVASGGKKASTATQKQRREVLRSSFKTLHECGFKIKKYKNFKEAHVKVLVQHWESNGITPRVIANRISILRTFAGWLGKTNMVKRPIEYLKEPDAYTISSDTEKDKGWKVQGVDALEKIEEIRKEEPIIAMQLEMMYAFGLRMQEALKIHPYLADLGDSIDVYRGVKGGRVRRVKIDTPYQRDVLMRAKGLTELKSESMIPRQYKYQTWRNHYYRVCRQYDISRDDKITSHGLRHDYLNDLFEEVAGTPSPVKGGDPISTVSQETLDYARIEVASAAGHSRKNISGAYIGEIKCTSSDLS